MKSMAGTVSVMLLLRNHLTSLPIITLPPKKKWLNPPHSSCLPRQSLFTAHGKTNQNKKTKKQREACGRVRQAVRVCGSPGQKASRKKQRRTEPKSGAPLAEAPKPATQADRSATEQQRNAVILARHDRLRRFRVDEHSRDDQLHAKEQQGKVSYRAAKMAVT